jgi:hypothetical protein
MASSINEAMEGPVSSIEEYSVKGILISLETIGNCFDQKYKKSTSRTSRAIFPIFES